MTVFSPARARATAASSTAAAGLARAAPRQRARRPCRGSSARSGARSAKLVLGIGDSLQGRLLLLDALGTTIDEVAVKRDPSCPVCGEHPTITEYVDYVEFCQGVRG